MNGVRRRSMTGETPQQTPPNISASMPSVLRLGVFSELIRWTFVKQGLFTTRRDGIGRDFEAVESTRLRVVELFGQ